MQQTQSLAKLMYLSWEIQRTKQHSRSKSLKAAWAIMQHADITIHYLVKKHSTQRKQASPTVLANLSLFQ